MNKYFVSFVLTTVLSCQVAAYSDPGPSLAARSAQLQCYTLLYSSLLSEAGLQDHSAKAIAHAESLKTLSSTANISAFNSFVSQTLRSDLSAANVALAGSPRTRMRQNYGAHRARFNECEYEALKQSVSAKSRYVSEEITRWRAIASDLQSPGLNASALTKLIDEADSQVLRPLQVSITAGGANPIKAALSQFCLSNGCPKGFNLHFYAKANIARLAALASATGGASFEQSLKIQSVLSHLENAVKELDKLPNGLHSYEDEAETWKHIALALDEFREVLPELNSVPSAPAADASGAINSDSLPAASGAVSELNSSGLVDAAVAANATTNASGVK
ncbi:TPA: hypothetical protein HA318_04865 [Candidatus Micrarchaeota archaeon]|nr:hypothetical protein [Candidatus Micrarchaeota archaeon]